MMNLYTSTISTALLGKMCFLKVFVGRHTQNQRRTFQYYYKQVHLSFQYSVILVR